VAVSRRRSRSVGRTPWPPPRTPGNFGVFRGGDQARPTRAPEPELVKTQTQGARVRVRSRGAPQPEPASGHSAHAGCDTRQHTMSLTRRLVLVQRQLEPPPMGLEGARYRYGQLEVSRPPLGAARLRKKAQCQPSGTQNSELRLRSSKRNATTCSGAASARVLLVRAHLLVAYCN
jgi:hypothetical protein